MVTKIKKLQLDENRRLIFISDIHGNILYFKKLLNKINYNDNDYLFILGDIIEKSLNNLDLLEYIMLLSNKENVFVLCGNCDNVLSYLIPPVDDNLLKFYALKKKKTIINDFAKKLGIEINKDSDMNKITGLFYNKFKKYYDFILNLNHIFIINDKICCCHGGIIDLDSISNNPLDIMKNDAFYFKNNNLSIPVIVGHYPTINYDCHIPKLNPIIDLDKKVISIDGGLNVVEYGQLNALIIDNLDNMNISYKYYDQFEKYRINKDFKAVNEDLYNITINEKEGIILEQDDDFSKVKINNHIIYAKNDEIRIVDSKIFVYNGFNYFFNLKKGEIIDVVYIGKKLSICKRDGIVGLVYTSYLEEKQNERF